MPSAAHDSPRRRQKGGGGAYRRFARRLLLAALGLCGLVAVALIGGGVLLNAGFAAATIDRAVDAQLSAMLGRPVDASYGQPRLSLDGFDRVAIDVSGASVDIVGDGRVIEAEDLSFSLATSSLLAGQLRLSGASARGARIDLTSLGASGGPDFHTADGLIDPERLAAGLRNGLNAIMGGLMRAGADRIRLRDVAVVTGGATGPVKVAAFTVDRSGRSLEVGVEVEHRGARYRIAGEAAFNGAGGGPGDFSLTLSVPEMARGDRLAIDATELSAAGSLAADGGRISLSMPETAIRLVADSQHEVDARVSIEAEFVPGSGKLEFNHVRLAAGRNRFDFNGALAPRPGPGAPAYRWEFVTDRATLAPADSPEPAMDLGARIAGYFEPATGLLAAEEIGVRTAGGEVLGTASLVFSGDISPATYLAINVPGLAVENAKQLWPVGAAPSARAWVLDKLFGGTVTDGFLEYKVKPGRLGAATLTADEITGHFRVERARFDVAGDMPPLRDAIGAIDFAGSDVHITLDSATAYLSTGRTVAASNGRLDIVNAHLKPVIGKLDIDVSGTADAVAELSSYKPINALKSIPFAPADLSGRVTGNVRADIPLDTAARALPPSFLVKLSYQDLAIAQPIDGQTVTGGDGTIVIDPRRAQIGAKAELNGIPAEIALVEPLGGDKASRQQKITLVVDDKTRERLAPGLGAIVSGPMRVTLADNAGKGRLVSADLGKARLDLPWIGWSKGAGVAAEASFRFAPQGDGTVRVSDFALTGKSFGITGAMTLRGTSLLSADFNNVRLNPGDRAAVTVKRSGKGYVVRVTGSSFDGRALVKQVLSDPVEVGSAIGTTSVDVDASLDSVLGFGDERLSGLSLTYQGTGKMVSKMAIAATSIGGGDVAITNTANGKSRTVRMTSSDAGALLRFLDIYDKMRGGSITLALAGGLTGALRGEIDARNFSVVDEPRLKSLVSSRANPESPSLSEAVRQDIDVSVVKFERGYSKVTKGRGLLELQDGILRGPLIGFSFQGTFYDPNNRMAMTGTLMPAYGLNRIFGEIPLVGLILGNGTDKGLIGITFKLAGKAANPSLQVNPLSVVAPGIFRSIFEFH